MVRDFIRENFCSLPVPSYCFDELGSKDGIEFIYDGGRKKEIDFKKREFREFELKEIGK